MRSLTLPTAESLYSVPIREQLYNQCRRRQFSARGAPESEFRVVEIVKLNRMSQASSAAKGYGAFRVPKGDENGCHCDRPARVRAGKP
jgi:hypothetical protein